MLFFLALSLFSSFLIDEWAALVFLYTLVFIIPEVRLVLVVKKERKPSEPMKNDILSLLFDWERKHNWAVSIKGKRKNLISNRSFLLLLKALRYVDSNNQSSSLRRLSSLDIQNNWIDKSLFVLSQSNSICFLFIRDCRHRDICRIRVNRNFFRLSLLKRFPIWISNSFLMAIFVQIDGSISSSAPLMYESQ